ncbi:MAG TPA: siphovirus Gp157 family protein [Urbifossiella sp.]|nr:siphovirus Gp157 family protein [Urbifossiella sp.]
MSGNLHLELGKVADLRALLGTDDPDLLHDCIEGQTDLFEIMDWLLGKLADEECLEDAIAARVKALGERKAACVNRQDRLRSALLMCMDASGQKSLRRPEATVSVSQKGPGIAHVDESVLPDAYWKTERKVSRSAITEALKAGTEVPGVTLGNGGVALTIRRK